MSSDEPLETAELEGRARILDDIRAATDEFERGEAKPTTAAELMREINS